MLYIQFESQYVKNTHHSDLLEADSFHDGDTVSLSLNKKGEFVVP